MNYPHVPILSFAAREGRVPVVTKEMVGTLLDNGYDGTAIRNSVKECQHFIIERNFRDACKFAEQMNIAQPARPTTQEESFTQVSRLAEEVMNYQPSLCDEE